MKNKITRLSLAVVISAAAAFGVAACGSSDDKGPDTPSSSSEETVSGEESEEFVADLKDGVKIVSDQVAAEPSITQIMLASDVDNPTQKYGMWVMPYYPSDATAKFISTIQVADGKFVVTATSAETGKKWEMDQDGNMTEAAE